MYCYCTALPLYTESITLIPESPQVLPDGILNIFTFLRCTIEFETSDLMVDHGWRLPSGNFLVEDNETNPRYRVEPISVGFKEGNVSNIVTVLTINGLSYQDAGVYSCEVRDTTTPNSEWITAPVELQLQGR